MASGVASLSKVVRPHVEALQNGMQKSLNQNLNKATKLATKIKESLPTVGEYIRSRQKSNTIAQKLAAFYYCWSFFYYMNCWIITFLITYLEPMILPLVIAYALYIHGPGARPSKDASWPTPMKDWSMWRLVASYFPVKLHKTVDIPSDRPYIFGFHPHGVVTFSGFLAFNTNALGFQNIFPGIDVRILTLNVNFRAPGLREYLLLHGTCSVDKDSCINILRKGKSISIVIGGGKESLYSKPRSADLVLNKRKGFVKIALQTGTSLVPVYSFGETDTFRTLNEFPEDSRLRRFQRWMLKKTGFTLPIVYGVGFFLPIGLLPYPVPIDVVVGAPIEVPKYDGDIDSAEFRALVDKYHGKYVNALKQLFDENKEKYGKGDVELRLVD